MANRKISYAKRDFASLKEEQINFIKNYYPEVIQNFQDASIMSVFLDLNAAIADNLHYHIDRSLQETVLDFAQERKSLFNIAKTYGLKIPPKSASMAIAEFTIEVPVLGDAEDSRYLPILKAGSQVLGQGQTFELLYDVDFSSALNTFGNIDQVKIPNVVNGNIRSYTIKKKGVIINGTTKVYTQVFGSVQPKPFYKIYLPDKDVLSVDSVITKDGIGLVGNPTYDDFLNKDYKWYEVNSLAENKVFITDRTVPPDSNGIYKGKYEEIDRKFIREYTPNGFCFLTFGAAIDDSIDILDEFIENGGGIDLSSLLDNKALGVAPKVNSTMYVKYRVGGGINSNVGVGVLDEVGTVKMIFDAPNEAVANTVENSLTAINITPAVGGSDEPTLDELRNYIGYNFSAQNRAVTLEDYKVIISKMPSKYGTPTRVGVKEINNKIEISVLTLDNEGTFESLVSSLMLSNIAEFLNEYRMINDYIIVKPGEVIDLGLKIELLMEEDNYTDIISKAITEVNNIFSNSNLEMGKYFYINEINKVLSSIEGVYSINSLKVFNKVGGDYSLNETSQPFSDVETREIDVSSGIIYADQNQILQIKKPEVDIVIRAKFSNISVG
jgi:hypothetical protein